jgi:hypothetical protein
MTTDSVPAHDEAPTPTTEDMRDFYVSFSRPRFRNGDWDYSKDTEIGEEFDRWQSSLLASARADGAREGRTVTTVDELNALPLDTVVVDYAGVPRTKRSGNSHMPGGWTHAGNSPLRATELADGHPMTVVYERHLSRAAVPLTERNNK